MSVSLSAVFDGDEFANLPSPFGISRYPQESRPAADPVQQAIIERLMWKLAEEKGLLER